MRLLDKIEKKRNILTVSTFIPSSQIPVLELKRLETCEERKLVIQKTSDPYFGSSYLSGSGPIF